METALGAIGVVAVAGFVIIIVIWPFRDAIRQRIEEGSKFEAKVGPSGAHLLLDEGAGVVETTGPELPDTLQPQRIPADPKLRHVVPPIDPERFRTVPFPIIDNPEQYNFPFAPTGILLLNGVPFFLRPTGDTEGRQTGHQVFDIQPTSDNTADIRELRANVENVVTVHILLTAGNGRFAEQGVDYLHHRIGYFELIFSDETTQRINLILGRNIREWNFSNFPGLVTDLDDYEQTTAAWVSHNSQVRIDHMRVSVQDGPKTLSTIRFVGQFEHDHPEVEVRTPSMIISAVTCERPTEL